MLVAIARPAIADEIASPRVNVLAVEPAEVDPVLARLVGVAVTVAEDQRAITIDDVAGEGAPRIGVVVRDGDALRLTAADGSWRLTGPLSRPRIAGPGYTVWVIGAPAADGTLRPRRLGVLRRPVAP